MPGLVPGIHVLAARNTWMAGTGPAMTENGASDLVIYRFRLRVNISFRI